MLFTAIQPMLLTKADNAFDDPAMVFEPKFDGFRLLLHKQGDRIEAYTRHGNIVTNKLPELRKALHYIQADTAILDCEGVCIRNGRSVFDDFAYRGRLSNPLRIEAATVTHPATFVVFDVLYSNGLIHVTETLMERKEILADIVKPSSVIAPTMFVDGQGIPLKKYTEEQGWEGIVAKRKNSRYSFSRSSDWIKIKNFRLADVVVLGYRREPQFGLIVGSPVSHRPLATVEFGFKPEEKIAFLQVAKEIHTKKQGDTQWVEPRIACRVQYLEQTEKGALRITSFKGFALGS